MIEFMVRKWVIETNPTPDDVDFTCRTNDNGDKYYHDFLCSAIPYLRAAKSEDPDGALGDIYSTATKEFIKKDALIALKRKYKKRIS